MEMPRKHVEADYDDDHHYDCDDTTTEEQSRETGNDSEKKLR